MAGRGRPSHLTDVLRARIEREFATGATVAVVAQRCGVPHKTLDRWLHTGKVTRRIAPAPPPAPEPDISLPERLARAEPGLVAAVLAAAQRGSWQAAAWILERRFPERWLKSGERPPAAPAGAASDPFADVIELAKRRR